MQAVVLQVICLIEHDTYLGSLPVADVSKYISLPRDKTITIRTS